MQIKFIPDKVLKLTTDEDLLGTKPYSETLFEIIDNCSGQKNIGLFGTWGSGKSTILSTLEDLIREYNNKKDKKGKFINKNNKIAYFEFDAWKYSQDDFRRSFLIELTSKFNIKNKSNLHKLLYNESSFENPVSSTYKFNWLSLPNWILVVLLVFGISFYFLPFLDLSKDIKAVISITALGFTVLSTALKNTVNKYKVVVKENRIVEPERFERIFDEIITELTQLTTSKGAIYNWIEKLRRKANFNKVVIIIDNLDRCDDENLLETLNTIKNFLEHSKVIFILPVDENGISAFLSNKTDSADEYLRKIFHLIIRLKQFSKKELNDFTSKLNINYSLGLNGKSIRIICQEFTNNPRKIIQFLNNYQSELKLIEQQDRLGYIDGEYIRDNISFLIKLLIIKYEWKNLYDEILYDKNLLSKINEVITALEPDDLGYYPIKRSKVKLTDTQRNFFFSTQEIHCSKIDPIILNIDLDKDVPDEIEGYIRNGNYESLKEYLHNEEIEFNESRLLQKINDVYSNLTYKHQEYLFIALPVLQILIKFILDKNENEFKQNLIENHDNYPFLKSLFKNSEILKLFDKFDFDNLITTAKWYMENISNDFYEKLMEYLNNGLFNVSTTVDNEEEKIESFINTFKDSDKLHEIKSTLGNKLVGKPELLTMSILEDYKIASQVLSKNNYKSIATNLSNEKLDRYSIRYPLSNLCLSYLESNPDDKDTRLKAIKYFFNEIEEFYNVESISKSTFVDYQDYFEKLNTILTLEVNFELPETLKNILEKINSNLYSVYTVDFDKTDYYDFYDAFFKLVKNCIFYTKKFNTLDLRNKYFGDFLKEGYSMQINLTLNEILYEDVNKHDVYNYPFASALIKHYLDSKKPIPFGKTLIRMIEKSKEGKGLSQPDIDQIILRTINLFAIKNSPMMTEYMKRLKNCVGKKFLEILNADEEILTNKYVTSVKSLNDDWFYGDSIFNYLNSNLENPENGSYPNFMHKLETISGLFSVQEQITFIDELIEYSDVKVYKWLRYSYKVLDKKVFDNYLHKLIEGHQKGVIGNNDFFEWIVNIPLKYFYQKRLKEFITYIDSLDIKHRTYKPKKESALDYLKGS